MKKQSFWSFLKEISVGEKLMLSFFWILFPLAGVYAMYQTDWSSLALCWILGWVVGSIALAIIHQDWKSQP